MTVSYTAEVATATLGTFGRLLFRWKASVYKLVWKEMLIFTLLYVFIAIIYRAALSCSQQAHFAAWAKHCKENGKVIPLMFVLGFFVTLIVNRWWSILMSIAWPDRACIYLTMCIPSSTPQMNLYRRAIARYLNLAQLLVLRDVSTSVKTRYPTLDQVVDGGFMTAEERKIFDSIKGENELEKHNRYWIVVQWALNVLCRAYDYRSIRDEQAFTKTFEQIVKFRDNLGLLLAYDWVSIPLSYTQVVTLAVYAYFMASLLGQQYIVPFCTSEEAATNETVWIGKNETKTIDNRADRIIEEWMPIFPILEFVFFMGYLKVAESIMNPLGQDDDDFEINYIINRNLAVSYGIVDTYRESCPTVKSESEVSLPSTNVKARSFRGSTEDFNPSENPDGTKKRRKRTSPGSGSVELGTGGPKSKSKTLTASLSSGPGSKSKLIPRSI